MLRESLQIDRICGLLHVIGGELYDPDDDLISDEELYHRYVDMLSDKDIDLLNEMSVMRAAERAAEGFNEPVAGAKLKLCKLLKVMFYAHAASRLRDKAGEILATLQ